MRNSRSRCGCGGAQVFECVHDLMGRIERRRSTLDDCDDRRRDRVQRERAELEIESSNPTSGRRKQNESDLDAKRKSYRRRRHEEEPNERERKTTRQNKDVMNECFWVVSLIVLEVSPGDPPDVPFRTPRKPPGSVRGLLGLEIVKLLIRFLLRTPQRMTAGESGKFDPPGPVWIWYLFGTLPASNFGVQRSV